MILVSFHVWEDARVWAHCSYSLGSHLYCLGTSILFFSVLNPLRVDHGGCCSGLIPVELEWQTTFPAHTLGENHMCMIYSVKFVFYFPPYNGCLKWNGPFYWYRTLLKIYSFNQLWFSKNKNSWKLIHPWAGLLGVDSLSLTWQSPQSRRKDRSLKESWWHTVWQGCVQSAVEHPEKKEQLVPLAGRGRDQAGLFLWKAFSENGSAEAVLK